MCPTWSGDARTTRFDRAVAGVAEQCHRREVPRDPPAESRARARTLGAPGLDLRTPEVLLRRRLDPHGPTRSAARCPIAARILSPTPPIEPAPIVTIRSPATRERRDRGGQRVERRAPREPDRGPPRAPTPPSASTVTPVDRRFARRVDVGQHDLVGPRRARCRIRASAARSASSGAAGTRRPAAGRWRAPPRSRRQSRSDDGRSRPRPSRRRLRHAPGSAARRRGTPPAPRQSGRTAARPRGPTVVAPSAFSRLCRPGTRRRSSPSVSCLPPSPPGSARCSASRTPRAQRRGRTPWRPTRGVVRQGRRSSPAASCAGSAPAPPRRPRTRSTAP